MREIENLDICLWKLKSDEFEIVFKDDEIYKKDKEKDDCIVCGGYEFDCEDYLRYGIFKKSQEIGV